MIHRNDIFKGTYRGECVYWSNGAFNCGGLAEYATMADLRAAVDRMIENTEKREAEQRAAQLAGGAIRCDRSGETVTVHFPDTGPRTMSIREFRRSVFDIEERYGRETVFSR